mmetsp:Transcript_12230/g.31010  ORF Transcript_12230/g.31010 Transcript_12230/m.31010 type:complete len:609 (+) Transcript_12230:612-2438(+)
MVTQIHFQIVSKIISRRESLQTKLHQVPNLEHTLRIGVVGELLDKLTIDLIANLRCGQALVDEVLRKSLRVGERTIASKPKDVLEQLGGLLGEHTRQMGERGGNRLLGPLEHVQFELIATEELGLGVGFRIAQVTVGLEDEHLAVRSEEHVLHLDSETNGTSRIVELLGFLELLLQELVHAETEIAAALLDDRVLHVDGVGLLHGGLQVRALQVVQTGGRLPLRLLHLGQEVRSGGHLVVVKVERGGGVHCLLQLRLLHGGDGLLQQLAGLHDAGEHGTSQLHLRMLHLEVIGLLQSVGQLVLVVVLHAGHQTSDHIVHRNLVRELLLCLLDFERRKLDAGRLFQVHTERLPVLGHQTGTHLAHDLGLAQAARTGRGAHAKLLRTGDRLIQVGDVHLAVIPVGVVETRGKTGVEGRFQLRHPRLLLHDACQLCARSRHHRVAGRHLECVRLGERRLEQGAIALLGAGLEVGAALAATSNQLHHLARLLHQLRVEADLVGVADGLGQLLVDNLVVLRHQRVEAAGDVQLLAHHLAQVASVRQLLHLKVDIGRLLKRSVQCLERARGHGLLQHRLHLEEATRHALRAESALVGLQDDALGLHGDVARQLE